MKLEYRKPAIFLDRDGVLTEEKGYITSVKNLNIFDYAANCIYQIHKKGYYAIVITNQSGIARGLFTEEQLHEINDYLMEKIGLDAIYYCPHHPEGKIKEYRKRCNCRKPGIGLFEAACGEFNIDLSASYMVGDRECDIIAGKNAGIKTILVKSGYEKDGAGKWFAPDYVLRDLREAVEII